MQPTALVHEAYLRLVDQRRVDWQNRAHFFGVAARIMRRILVDHARRHTAGKRGDRAQRISIDDAPDIPAPAEMPERPELLRAEMARLQRSCHRLVWLNPLLGAPGYQPLTQGMRAALPYIDEFLPIHNLQSLEALADLLGRVEDQPPLRRFIPPPAAA